MNEIQLAETLERFEGLLTSMQGQYGTLEDRVKTFANVFGLDDADSGKLVNTIDLKKLREDIDAIKSYKQLMEAKIRNSKSGPYVSGCEDVDFSLVKAMLGIKMGGTKTIFEDLGAGQEFELLKQVQEKHFESYIKTAGFSYKAAQQIGDDSLGGAWVPDQTIPDVISAVYFRSAFLNFSGEGDRTRVTTLNGLTGGTVRIPRHDSGIVAYWVDEEEAPTESSDTTDMISLSPNKLGVLVRLTEEMQQFTGFGLENLIRTSMTRAMAKKIDHTIAYGVGGANMPTGIVNTPGIKVYSAEAKDFYTNDPTNPTAANTLNGGSWNGAELDFDDLENMNLLVEEENFDVDNPTWISSRRYFTRLKQLKTFNYSGATDQQPYLLGGPMIPHSKLEEIIGDVGWTNQIPTTNDPGETFKATPAGADPKFTDVFGGDLSQVMVGRWAGLGITSDNGMGTGFAQGYTQLRATTYLDINVARPQAITVCPDAKCRD